MDFEREFEDSDDAQLLIPYRPMLDDVKESHFSVCGLKTPIPLPLLPAWMIHTPMHSKLPMIPAPKGKIVLFTTGLCEKLYCHPSDLEFDSSPDNFTSEYTSLHDPHLKSHYSTPVSFTRLIKYGYITKEGKVKCTVGEFNEYHQYLKRIKLDKLTQERKRLMEIRKEKKQRMIRVQKKNHKLNESEKRGVEARKRKQEGIQQWHKSLVQRLQQDDEKRANLLEEYHVQRSRKEKMKSLHCEKMKLQRKKLDIEAFKQKGNILQKSAALEKKCTENLQKRRKALKAEREKKLETQWNEREKVRESRTVTQAIQRDQMKAEMHDNLIKREQELARQQAKTQVHFQKIRDQKKQSLQECENSIKKNLSSKLKKVEKKFQVERQKKIKAKRFPPIDLNFKNHISRKTLWEREMTFKTEGVSRFGGAWDAKKHHRQRSQSPSPPRDRKSAPSPPLSSKLPPIKADSSTDARSCKESDDPYDSVAERLVADIFLEIALEELDMVDDSVEIEADKIVDVHLFARKIVEEVFCNVKTDVGVESHNRIITSKETSGVSQKWPVEPVSGRSSLRTLSFIRVMVMSDVDLVAKALVNNVLYRAWLEDACQNTAFCLSEDGNLDQLEGNAILMSQDEMERCDVEEDLSEEEILQKVVLSFISQAYIGAYIFLKSTGELQKTFSISSVGAEISSKSGEMSSFAASSKNSAQNDNNSDLPCSLAAFVSSTITEDSQSSSLSSLMPRNSSRSVVASSTMVSSCEIIYEESESDLELEEGAEIQIREEIAFPECSHLSAVISIFANSNIDLSNPSSMQECILCESGGEEEIDEVIGIVENEIIAEELSNSSLDTVPMSSVDGLTEVVRVKEDGSMVIEGAVKSSEKISEHKSVTEVVLSINNLKADSSDKIMRGASSGNLRLCKSATEKEGAGSGDITGRQYYSVIPVFQDNLITVSDALIKENLQVISAKPDANQSLPKAYETSARNSFRNVFRPDLTYCKGSARCLRDTLYKELSDDKELDTESEHLKHVLEQDGEEDMGDRSSEESLVNMEESGGVCYLPKHKTYRLQCTLDEKDTDNGEPFSGNRGSAEDSEEKIKDQENVEGDNYSSKVMRSISDDSLKEDSKSSVGSALEASKSESRNSSRKLQESAPPTSNTEHITRPYASIPFAKISTSVEDNCQFGTEGAIKTSPQLCKGRSLVHFSKDVDLHTIPNVGKCAPVRRTSPTRFPKYDSLSGKLVVEMDEEMPDGTTKHSVIMIEAEVDDIERQDREDAPDSVVIGDDADKNNSQEGGVIVLEGDIGGEEDDDGDAQDSSQKQSGTVIPNGTEGAAENGISNQDGEVDTNGDDDEGHGLVAPSIILEPSSGTSLHGAYALIRASQASLIVDEDISESKVAYVVLSDESHHMIVPKHGHLEQKQSGKNELATTMRRKSICECANSRPLPESPKKGSSLSAALAEKPESVKDNGSKPKMTSEEQMTISTHTATIKETYSESVILRKSPSNKSFRHIKTDPALSPQSKEEMHSSSSELNFKPSQSSSRKSYGSVKKSSQRLIKGSSKSSAETGAMSPSKMSSGTLTKMISKPSGADVCGTSVSSKLSQSSRSTVSSRKALRVSSHAQETSRKASSLLGQQPFTASQSSRHTDKTSRKSSSSLGQQPSNVSQSSRHTEMTSRKSSLSFGQQPSTTSQPSRHANETSRKSSSSLGQQASNVSQSSRHTEMTSRKSSLSFGQQSSTASQPSRHANETSRKSSLSFGQQPSTASQSSRHTEATSRKSSSSLRQQPSTASQSSRQAEATSRKSSSSLRQQPSTASRSSRQAEATSRKSSLSFGQQPSTASQSSRHTEATSRKSSSSLRQQLSTASQSSRHTEATSRKSSSSLKQQPSDASQSLREKISGSSLTSNTSGGSGVQLKKIISAPIPQIPSKASLRVSVSYSSKKKVSGSSIRSSNLKIGQESKKSVTTTTTTSAAKQMSNASVTKGKTSLSDPVLRRESCTSNKGSKGRSISSVSQITNQSREYLNSKKTPSAASKELTKRHLSGVSSKKNSVLSYKNNDSFQFLELQHDGRPLGAGISPVVSSFEPEFNPERPTTPLPPVLDGEGILPSLSLSGTSVSIDGVASKQSPGEEIGQKLSLGRAEEGTKIGSETNLGVPSPGDTVSDDKVLEDSTSGHAVVKRSCMDAAASPPSANTEGIPCDQLSPSESISKTKQGLESNQIKEGDPADSEDTMIQDKTSGSNRENVSQPELNTDQSYDLKDRSDSDQTLESQQKPNSTDSQIFSNLDTEIAISSVPEDAELSSTTEENTNEDLTQLKKSSWQSLKASVLSVFKTSMHSLKSEEESHKYAVSETDVQDAAGKEDARKDDAEREDVEKEPSSGSASNESVQESAEGAEETEQAMDKTSSPVLKIPEAVFNMQD